MYGGGRYWRVGPTRFYRPYYTFRPRFSIGFGIWAGYPFAYADPFYDPYAYSYPYAYDYSYADPYGPYVYGDPSVYPSAPAPYPNAPAPPPATYQAPYSSDSGVTVQPNQADMGGMSFDITPADAQIFVDGRLLGTVGQFTPTSQPLGLPAGHHRLEIRAEGYRTMSFDVDIVAGQVIPYQGTLQQ